MAVHTSPSPVSRSPCPRLPPYTPVPRPDHSSSQPGLGTAGTWPDNERTPTLFQPRLTSLTQTQRYPLQNNNTTPHNTTLLGLDTARPESTRIGSTTIHRPSRCPRPRALHRAPSILTSKQNTCSAWSSKLLASTHHHLLPRLSVAKHPHSERDLFFPCRSLTTTLTRLATARSLCTHLY